MAEYRITFWPAEPTDGAVPRSPCGERTVRRSTALDARISAQNTLNQMPAHVQVATVAWPAGRLAKPLWILHRGDPHLPDAPVTREELIDGLRKLADFYEQFRQHRAPDAEPSEAIWRARDLVRRAERSPEAAPEPDLDLLTVLKQLADAALTVGLPRTAPAFVAAVEAVAKAGEESASWPATDPPAVADGHVPAPVRPDPGEPEPSAGDPALAARELLALAQAIKTDTADTRKRLHRMAVAAAAAAG